MDFARNYTGFLVSLHNVFNGAPDKLGETISQMYSLKTMAINLMESDDPRLEPGALGIGPPWEYVVDASQFQARGGRARPLVSNRLHEAIV